MRLPELFKPPRHLLAVLLLLTLASVSSLAWFGWKLAEQDRIVEARMAQDRLEQAADRIAATLRGAMAETGERLSGWAISPPAAVGAQDGLLLILTENGL